MNNKHINAKVLIVGQNPGECYDGKFKDWEYDEILWNCNLGNFLKELLIGVVPFEDAYFTNLVNCMSPSNRVVEDSELDNCHYIFNLRMTVLTNIKMAIVLGSRAKKFLEWVDPELRRNTLCIYHPSYLDRRVSKEERSKWIEKYRLQIKRIYDYNKI